MRLLPWRLYKRFCWPSSCEEWYMGGTYTS